MTTSADGSSGVASACAGMKLISCRYRSAALSRPIHSGRRITWIPSRRSRYGRTRLPQKGAG